MRKIRILSAQVVTMFFAGLLISCGGGAGGSGGSPVGAGSGGDTAPAKALVVASVNVPDGSVGVDPRAKFIFALSATFGPSGLTSDQVQLSDGSKTYPVAIDIANYTLTVKPLSGLPMRRDYSLTIKAGATGSDGSVLKNDYVIKFRTLLAAYETRQLTPADRSVTGINLPRIIITDINGDGRPDLVELAALYRPDLFAANGYTINIYLQNAAGGFDKFQKLEFVADQSGYAKYFNSLIALDIDGDNKPELLVPEYRVDDAASAGIRVFKAGSDGKFVAKDFVATNYTETLQALDVDGDGKLDLVGSNRRAIDQVTGGFQVLLGTPGGFIPLAPVAMPNGGYEFGVADLDQDGKRELIVNRLFSKPGNGPLTTELLIYSQGAAGVFSLNAALTNEAIGFCAGVDYCRRMKIVDLDGDGKPDLVFGAQPLVDANMENLVLAFSRKAGGGFTRDLQVSIGSNTSVFGIQDMDGDGVPDLVMIGVSLDGIGSANFFTIVGGAPHFSFEFSTRIDLPVGDTMYPPNVAIGDIDGDGQPDIVFDSYNSGIVMARHIQY